MIGARVPPTLWEDKQQRCAPAINGVIYLIGINTSNKRIMMLISEQDADLP